MDFEAAATLHKQWEKVRAAALLADELVRPVAELRAVILQEAAPARAKTSRRPEAAAVFLLEHGQLAGPERLSTLGVRAVREQTAVGSCLFAQPLMLAPIPLDEPAPTPAPTDAVILSEGAARSRRTPSSLPTQTAHLSTLTPEDRARAVLDALAMHTESAPDIAEICDYLSLFRRWYYRPEKQRAGEVFLPNPDDHLAHPPHPQRRRPRRPRPTRPRSRHRSTAKPPKPSRPRSSTPAAKASSAKSPSCPNAPAPAKPSRRPTSRNDIAHAAKLNP